MSFPDRLWGSGQGRARRCEEGALPSTGGGLSVNSVDGLPFLDTLLYLRPLPWGGLQAPSPLAGKYTHGTIIPFFPSSAKPQPPSSEQSLCAQHESRCLGPREGHSGNVRASREVGVSGDGPAPMLCFLSEKWGESRGDQSAPTSSFHAVTFSSDGRGSSI